MGLTAEEIIHMTIILLKRVLPLTATVLVKGDFKLHNDRRSYISIQIMLWIIM